MSTANLHSLINGKWFIHESYGKSLLPALFSIIRGKDNPLIQKSDRKEFDFVTTKDFNLVSGAAYNSSESQQDYVAVINMKDPIYKYDQYCGPAGTKSKMNTMQRYLSDPFCKGVVMDIDSGGGQVYGTPEFFDFVKSFAKPVVAYTDGLMCSAAYYIGSAADFVIANPRADAIGSIGVMVFYIDMTGIYQKEGATIIEEYADQSSDKNKSFRELLKGNPELYIKQELNPIADTFINDVKSVRPGVSEDVFTGSTYNAEEALSLSLIDQLGTLQDAVNKVFELSQASNSNLNNSSMSKIKAFPSVQQVIGAEGEGLEIKEKSWVSSTEGVFLSEPQIDSLEASIAAHETALASEKEKVTTANGKVTSMVSAVDQAIEAAGLTAEVAADATTDQKIALLGAKVNEFRSNPRSKGSNPDASGDNFETESISDPNAAHNKVYENA